MSVGPVNTVTPAASARGTGPAQPATGQPAATDLRDAFARDLLGAGKRLAGREGGKPGLVVGGQPELGQQTGQMEAALMPARTPHPKSAPGFAAALARAGVRDERHDDQAGGLQLFQPGAVPLGAAAAPPPAPMSPQVDPSAFADMLTRLWVRERDRQTKEVRVSFGDSAWPATGARLTRLPDGSLSVAVEMGDARGRHGADLDTLREQLTARGLQVGELAVDQV